MGQVVALTDLLHAQQIWRGQSSAPVKRGQPTGWSMLDAALPTGGWPDAALTEILLPADGVGEIDLLIPTLRRLTQAQQPVVLIAPPYVPYPPGWEDRGVTMHQLHIVDARPTASLWAFEQCLRSGTCAAVIGWPNAVDQHGLRRLQVAADTGKTLGFVLRDRKHAINASPASLRLEIDVQRLVRVRKCRGGNVPAQAFPIPFGH